MNEDKTGKGLSILILWNNRLTKKSSPYFSRIIVCITNISIVMIFHGSFCDLYTNYKKLLICTIAYNLFVNEFYLAKLLF